MKCKLATNYSFLRWLPTFEPIDYVIDDYARLLHINISGFVFETTENTLCIKKTFKATKEENTELNWHDNYCKHIYWVDFNCRTPQRWWNGLNDKMAVVEWTFLAFLVSQHFWMHKTLEICIGLYVMFKGRQWGLDWDFKICAISSIARTLKSQSSPILEAFERLLKLINYSGGENSEGNIYSRHSLALLHFHPGFQDLKTLNTLSTVYCFLIPEWASETKAFQIMCPPFILIVMSLIHKI